MLTKNIRKESELELESVEFVERLTMGDEGKGESKMTLLLCFSNQVDNGATYFDVKDWEGNTLEGKELHFGYVKFKIPR